MRTSLATLLATAALACFAPSARAEINWSYLGDAEVKITSGNSTITFMATAGSAANSSGVVLYNMTASSTTPNSGPADHFDKAKFELSVSIVDDLARSTKTGNELGTFTLTGFFTGNMTKGSLTDWAVEWGTSAGSVVLGNKTVGFRQYDVQVDGFLPPSPNIPTANGLGVLHANVTVRETEAGENPEPPTGPGPDVPPDPSEAPEPSSLVLAGLALSTVTIARRRRRKANETASAQAE